MLNASFANKIWLVLALVWLAETELLFSCPLLLAFSPGRKKFREIDLTKKIEYFLSFFRAFDNFRMGIISQTNINVAGSHCGVSIGEDGPSQMGLEDIAMFRTLPGATVFYPT